MVSQKYRWDFIGLSTDEKPTSETSDKVVNGSTYYCSDTSKLYVYCDGTWYERKPLGGGGGGTSNFDQLTNRPKYNGSEMTSSTDIPEVKTYTAGSNISISAGNEISATDTKYTAGTNVSISDQNVISATDTTYSNFTGTDGTTAGSAGLVPAPATTDAGKFLKADGTWDTAGGSGPTVVQTTGTSTTDVMSQKAVTGMVFADNERRKVRIGSMSDNSASSAVAIGYYASAKEESATAVGQFATVKPNSYRGVALGCNAVVETNAPSAVAIGYGAKATQQGQFDISMGDSQYAQTAGYNSSNYRLLTGLYDGQSAHDAATYGQVISYSAINGAGAPTTATEGKYVGQLYYDTTNESMYFLKTIDTTTTPATYTWEALGGGSSVNVVQTTGTSTTDVMSQDAVTGMVFADPSTKNNVNIGGTVTVGGQQNNYVNIEGSLGAASSGVCIRGSIGSSSSGSVAIGNSSSVGNTSQEGIAIGKSASASGAASIAMGGGATTSSRYSTVIGGGAKAKSAESSIALGYGAATTMKGQMDISTLAWTNTAGYNNSQYRLLTGLYDPQSAHDAATKGYVDPSTDSSAPTTATVGRLGQIQIDTTNNDAYMCVAADDVTPTYTWKKITA